MGACLKIFLTREQNRTIFELRMTPRVSEPTKDRAVALPLSAQGCHVEKIADYFKWETQTVRQTIHHWIQQTISGIMDAGGWGAQRRWHQADMIYLEQCLEK